MGCEKVGGTKKWNEMKLFPSAQNGREKHLYCVSFLIYIYVCTHTHIYIYIIVVDAFDSNFQLYKYLSVP